MNKTKYIFLSNGYIGGASRFTFDHLCYLAKKKNKTILIDDNPYKTYSTIPHNTLVKKIKTNHFTTESKKELSKLFLNDNIKKIVFLTNYAFLIKYFSLINKLKNKNIKIILTIHSGLFNLSFKKYIAGLIFSLIYKKIDYLYFGSNSAKQWWLTFYPWMDIKKNLVHFNGVELQKKFKIKKKSNNLSISFVGRLEKENNPEFFINIAHDYLKNDKKVKFNVYGEGTLRNHLKNITKSNRIKFYGWKEKKSIYKHSDVIIITSKINNFPYVALEAKSYGVPVISCSKGDVKKIVKNNFDGYIIYTNSSKKIINLIKKISKNYSKFSRNSIKRSKLFEINVACKKFWKNIL